MTPPSLGPRNSLRSLPPGTLAAACSGDLFRLRSGCGATPGAGARAHVATRLDRAQRSAPAHRKGMDVSEAVGFSVFEIDPPIPLCLPSDEKAALATQRARLVRCNGAMAELSGYGSVDALEGAALGQLLGRSAEQSRAYFRTFFEHDLVHEGLVEEQDPSGRVRVFATRSLGIDREGMLYEVLSTKARVQEAASARRRATKEARSDAKRPEPRSIRGRARPPLAASVRQLSRTEVDELLARVHDELAHRRHALLEYQQHGLGPGLLPRLRAREDSPPDPNTVFQHAQATVLSVLEDAVRDQRARSTELTGRSSAAGATADPAEFQAVLGVLQRLHPGAAERLLAEVLVHWKAKEELARRTPKSSCLAWELGPRTLRSALRALVGDPSLSCMWKILRRAELA